MTSKFDNLSLEQLFEREREAREERFAIIKAITDRMLSECPVKPGYLYTTKPGCRFHGRHMLVVYRNVVQDRFFRFDFHIQIQGPLRNPKAISGDTFNVRMQIVDASVIDLTSEEPCPENARRRIMRHG